jgi:hypothetical protein
MTNEAHPAFLVRDLEAVLQRCRAAGAAVAEGEPLAGDSRAYVFDP